MPSALPAALSESLPAPLRNRLQTARELARRSAIPPLEPLATTIEPFDRLLEGGLPRGRLVELIGRRSSGRFSIVLATLAAATGAAETSALVDLGDAFDPQAAEVAGTTLERLLWVRPKRMKEALISTEMLLGAGFPLVVLDLGQPPIPGGRGIEAFWLRLARASAAQDSALLVSSPYRVSGTAAAAVVQARGNRPTWLGRGRQSSTACRLLTGCHARLTLKKLHGQGVSARTEPLRLRVESPIPDRTPDLPPPEPTHHAFQRARHARVTPPRSA